MARKRLSLTGPFGTPPLASLETKSLGTPPIAHVAGDAAASAALAEMSEAWTEARDTGRLVQALPLAAVDETWLVRDRIALDTEEMADLVESIRERGQQVPIEVVALEGGRFGLISGWRRLRALKVLHEGRDGARFAEVLALLRRPAGAAEAYRAMVEENEIRANLSYYERARIALRAAETGAFPDPRAAVAALFSAGSRAKRSKIGSFLGVVEALDDKLSFGWAIPERLGLDLAKALDELPGFRDRLRDRLRKAEPGSAEAEMNVLTRALVTNGRSGANRVRTSRRKEVMPGLWLEAAGEGEASRLILRGLRVDTALEERLLTWLRQNLAEE